MLSAADRQFQSDFAAGRISPAAFSHRAHIRLAYTFLAEHDPDEAVVRMRSALQGFLQAQGIEATKYHETLTTAWIRAVRHFMSTSAPAGTADEFIDANPRMLDPKIMLTHYSAEVLFSPEARARFVEPDRDRIP